MFLLLLLLLPEAYIRAQSWKSHIFASYFPLCLSHQTWGLKSQTEPTDPRRMFKLGRVFISLCQDNGDIFLLLPLMVLHSILSKE